MRILFIFVVSLVALCASALMCGHDKAAADPGHLGFRGFTIRNAHSNNATHRVLNLSVKFKNMWAGTWPAAGPTGAQHAMAGGAVTDTGYISLHTAATFANGIQAGADFKNFYHRTSKLVRPTYLTVKAEWSVDGGDDVDQTRYYRVAIPQSLTQRDYMTGLALSIGHNGSVAGIDNYQLHGVIGAYRPNLDVSSSKFFQSWSADRDKTILKSDADVEVDSADPEDPTEAPYAQVALVESLNKALREERAAR